MLKEGLSVVVGVGILLGDNVIVFFTVADMEGLIVLVGASDCD